jgi:hypothetical protein
MGVIIETCTKHPGGRLFVIVTVYHNGRGRWKKPRKLTAFILVSVSGRVFTGYCWVLPGLYDTTAPVLAAPCGPRI